MTVTNGALQTQTNNVMKARFIPKNEKAMRKLYTLVPRQPSNSVCNTGILIIA